MVVGEISQANFVSFYVSGFTNELGAFHINFHPGGDKEVNIMQTSYLIGYCPREDKIVNAVASAIGVHNVGHHEFNGLTYMKSQQNANDAVENLWVAEFTVQPSGDPKTKTVAFEVEFVSQATTSSDAVPLVGQHYEAELVKHSHRFQEQFSHRFSTKSSKYSEEQARHLLDCLTLNSDIYFLF